MLLFFDKLKQNIEKYPEKIILRSENYPQGITYLQLDNMSGRVCKYLKERNIGKEDFVMILMPREVTAYVAVLGIWKAGAAMTLLEEDYSRERVEYIKKDLNCKLVITSDIFDEMMNCTPDRRYDVPDEHDACMTIYTSGSTGTPKGVLHEFGKLDYMIYAYSASAKNIPADGIFAMVSPINFVASIRNALRALMIGETLLILPYSVAKNTNMLPDFIVKNHITEIYMTPSYAKLFKKFPSCLCNLFLGGEACNSVYFENTNTINNYSCSEVAFPICSGIIDKKYDIAPVGYPNENTTLRFVNENGTDVGTGEIGEIIVRDYFTRGYIGLPEKTAEAFVDGYFHTGDLGYIDENGNVFLYGRKDDMIKINGNRIEPAEIEKSVLEILGVKSAVAKGFVTDGRSFVAVYLLRDELEEFSLLGNDGKLVFTANEMKHKLATYLPDYMIPLYYVILEDFPKNMNGKLSRTDLPEPSAEDYQYEYKAPKNEKEAYFCKLFEKVLKLNKVGVNDDFYEIGGDSLTAILAVSECEKYNLSISDFFQNGTPRKLAQITSDSDHSEMISENRHALSVPQTMMPESRAFYDIQKEYPHVTVYNLFRFYKLFNGIDILRFKKCVDIVMRKHPVFSSIIHTENGNAKMYYKPELFKETEIKSVDKDEFEKLKIEERQAFEIEDSLLYRRVIYQCDNEYYFYLEIHHCISDGTSIKQLLEQICELYRSDKYEIPTDFYYLVMQRDNRLVMSTVQYELEEYSDVKFHTLKTDYSVFKTSAGRIEGVFSIDKDKVISSKLFQVYQGNTLFLACFLKTVAEFNEQDKSFALWVYSGRDEMIKQNTHGTMIRSFPMTYDRMSISHFNDYLEYVQSICRRQISGYYSENIDTASSDDFLSAPCFVYQKDILTFGHLDNIVIEEIKQKPSKALFEFDFIDNENEKEYRYVLKYSDKMYREESIRRFCAMFENHLKKIVYDDFIL